MFSFASMLSLDAVDPKAFSNHFVATKHTQKGLDLKDGERPDGII
jgi:hypothetical protein